MAVRDIPVRAVELRECEVLCYEDGHLLWRKMFPNRVQARMFYRSIVVVESEGPTILPVHTRIGLCEMSVMA